MQSSYLTDKDRPRGAGAVGGVAAFLLVLRFVGVLGSLRRGVLATILAIGILLLFVWAMLTWRKYSSRD